MKYDQTKKIGEACFWIGLIIELLIVIVDKSAYINPLESHLFRLTFLLFCVKIALTKYSTKEWIGILLTGILLFVSYQVNEKDEAVRVIAFIAACKGIEIKKLMRVVFWITFTGCVLLILLSVTGLYGSISMTADFGRGGQGEQLFETRYTLGMGHPNALHGMLWLVGMLAFYCYVDSAKWYWFALFPIIDIILFLLTDSKTGFLVWLMSAALIPIMKYNKNCREAKGVYLLGATVVIGCIVFSMLGSHIENTYFTTDSLMHKLDKMLNGRYQSCYAVEAARLENWKWFAAAKNTEYFDAGFVRLFYWYGIIPGILYILMNFYLLYQSYKEKDSILFCMVVVFSVYNLMEAHFISVYLLRNYLFVLMGYYWYQPFAKKQEFEGYFWQVKGLLGKV